MEITALTLKILFIFIPGIVGTEILFKLIEVDKNVRRERYIISSFLLGAISYVLLNLLYLGYQLIISVYNFISSRVLVFNYSTLEFFKFIEEKSASINAVEVTCAIMVSIILGIFVAYINNKKVISKFAHRNGISMKFDELDVWSYVMNSDEKCWIIIRDLSNDLLYEGWPKAYSNTHKDCEILLSNVAVYRNTKTKKPLYLMDQAYFSFKEGNMVVEFRKGENKK